ncbi:MAG: S8 family serine peptidase [Candidatus Zixiibacteriota bacterium]
MSTRKLFYGRIGGALICIVAMLLTIGSVFAGDNDSRPYDDNGRTNDDIPVIEAPPHSTDQIVVKFTEMGDATINAVMSEYGTTVEHYLPQLGVYLIGVPKSIDPEVLITELQSDSRIVSAHLNYLIDPMRPVQGSFAFPDENLEGSYLYQPAAVMLNVAGAHQIATGAGVKVAVIDGGVDKDHPAFDEKVVSRFDYVDNDYDCSDEPGGSNSGHGTFVAGIVHLIAPDAVINAYRVCDPNGAGDGYLVAEAIMQAIKDECDVINLSLVTVSNHEAIATAIEYAKINEVLVVAAAGNGVSETPLYPASDPYVISVGAVDNDLQIANFSNVAEYIDVYAPGVDVYSPYLESGYAWWSGTSFATPFVTGQAALIYQIETPADEISSRDWVVSIIRQTLNTLDDAGETSGVGFGGGIIDLVASLQSDPPVFGALVNYQHYPDVIIASTSTTARDYAFIVGTEGLAPHSFTIQNVDTPEFVTSITSDGNSTSTFAYFTIDPTGLALGTYQDTVLVTIDGAYNSPITKVFTLVVSNEENPIEAYGVFTNTSRLVEGSTDTISYTFQVMGRQWDSDLGRYVTKNLPYQVSLESNPEFICGVALYDDYPWGSQYYDGLTNDYWRYYTTVGNLTPGLYYDTIYIYVDSATNNPYILEIVQDVRPDEWIEFTVLEPYPANLTLDGYSSSLKRQEITFHNVPYNTTQVDTLNIEMHVDGDPRDYSVFLAHFSSVPNAGFFDLFPTSGTTTDTIQFIIDWSQHNCPYVHDSVLYCYRWEVEAEYVADYVYYFWLYFNLVDTQQAPEIETTTALVNEIANYPNPFNPVTEIKFSLVHDADVKLGVFNILGQSVKVLVDGQMTAGAHSVVWDGKDEFGQQVASGIYFYKIVAGDYVESRKMILLK